MQAIDDDACDLVWAKCSLAVAPTCRRAMALYEHSRALARLALMSWSMIASLRLFRRVNRERDTERFDRRFKMIALSGRYEKYAEAARVPCMCFRFERGVGVRMRRYSD